MKSSPERRCWPSCAFAAKTERAGEQLPVDVGLVRLDVGDQLVDEVLVMPFDVDDSHELSVLARSGEPPPQEWPLRQRTMLPMSVRRRRERKVVQLARLLVALDARRASRVRAAAAPLELLGRRR